MPIRLVDYCKTCGISFNEVRRYSNKNQKLNCCRKCYLEKVKQRATKYRKAGIKKRLQHKTDLVNQLGGACQMCGYDNFSCLAAFEFHHINNTKEMTISNIINIYRGSKFGRKKADKEIKNCILVCANCHRKIHLGGKNAY